MDNVVRWIVGLVVALAIIAGLVWMRGQPIGPHPSHPIAALPAAERIGGPV